MTAVETQQARLQRASTLAKQRERLAVEKTGDQQIVDKVHLSLITSSNAKALQV